MKSRATQHLLSVPAKGWQPQTRVSAELPKLAKNKVHVFSVSSDQGTLEIEHVADGKIHLAVKSSSPVTWAMLQVHSFDKTEKADDDG